jgi:hypothetical protein
MVVNVARFGRLNADGLCASTHLHTARSAPTRALKRSLIGKILGIGHAGLLAIASVEKSLSGEALRSKDLGG